jgi:hypothetical protein
LPLAITFNLPAGINTIGLGSALPALISNFEITGPQSGVTIQRNSGTTAFRIFTVSAGNDTISNLTLTNGSAPTVLDNDRLDRRGGAVFIATGATASLSGMSLNWNYANFGGGAIANDGTVTVTNSYVFGNSTTFSGGGIENAGIATISNTFIGSNSASSGGGIFNRAASDGRQGRLIVENGSDISGNTANGLSGTPVSSRGRGGAIANYGTLTLSNASLWYNTSLNGGGGLFTNGDATLTNADLEENSATSTGRGKGGGIYVLAGTTTLVSGCTVYENYGGWTDNYDGIVYNSNAVLVPNYNDNPGIIDPVWNDQ